MTVRFLRVLGVRAQNPVVVAFVDDYAVRWDAHGWTCTCPAECPHVDVVLSLLDPRVIGATS
jgi:hypothetical protein